MSGDFAEMEIIVNKVQLKIYSLYCQHMMSSSASLSAGHGRSMQTRTPVSSSVIRRALCRRDAPSLTVPRSGLRCALR